MRFIRTDRGQYFALSAVARVERENPERPPGKADDGIRKFSFYNINDDLLGSIRVTEARLEFLLAEFVPAQQGEKVITLHFDNETKTVGHSEHQVIAWAILPSSDFREPVLNTDQGWLGGRGVAMLIQKPNGKLDDIFSGEYDSLDAAKSEFLKRCLPDDAEQR